MLIRNKLDKSFGPVGTTAGFVLIIAGLFATFTSWMGLLLILLGAFLSFTSTATVIDASKKRVKFANIILGVINMGHWMNIESEMKVIIKESNITWRAYSRSNRPLDIDNNDFRLILLNKDGEEIMELKKYATLASAEAELETIKKLLGLV